MSRECPFGVETCLCISCRNNRALPGSVGYCVECYQCALAGRSVHNVVDCGSFETEAETGQEAVQ